MPAGSSRRRWTSPTSAASRTTGCAQPATRSLPASTSSTSMALTRTCPASSCRAYYNTRSDNYGGPLANRARFWIETIERVRAEIEGEAAVAVRMAVDLTPGITLDDALAFIRLADPLVDLWDVNVGSLTEWSTDSGSSRFYREGYQLEWTGRVREATAKPIVGVGRLTSPDRMAEIIRSGAWDLIGAARPSIADPFLPRKIEQGRYDEIRECTGSNACIARVIHYGHLGCVQNPTAGEEYRRGWHPERVEPLEDPARDVLIIGAGPAGMECAIILAETRPASCASRRRRRCCRRRDAVDPAASRPRRVGPRRELAADPTRSPAQRRGDPADAAE